MPGQAAQVPRRLGLGTGGALAGARGQVGARRHWESPGGGRGVSRPGGPPGAGGPGSGRGARLLSASGRAPGPASRDASLPFRPELGPRLPGSPRRSPPASGPPLRAPRSRDLPHLLLPPLSPLRPSSPRVPSPVFPDPPSLPAAGAGTSRPGPRRRVSERRGSATLSRRRHCALSGAARGWRAAVAAGGKKTQPQVCGAGTHCRSPSDPGRAASPEPAARRSPPREGGWAAAWGGVSRPPQWLPRSQVDRRPPPPPRLRAVTSATQPQSLRGSSWVCQPTAERRPADPSPPVLAPRRLPLEK